MDEESNDSTFIDPEIFEKELVVSLPILNESDIEVILNGAESSSEGSSLDENEQKPCLKRDQRRSNLLNNPDYGIILSFMDKFRPHICTKDYPLRILEDNLVCEKQKSKKRSLILGKSSIFLV